MSDSGKRKSAGERALDIYANPAVRTVVQAVATLVGHPIAGLAADNLLTHRRETLGQRRIGLLGEEFVRAGKIPADEMRRRIIEDDPFATAVIATFEVVSRTERDEKIRMFARMLSNYDTIVVGSTKDDYEELLRTLDGMSYREWQILLTLKNLEDDEPRRRSQSSLPHNYWPEFTDKAARNGVPRDELAGFVTRLVRTGCFQLIDQSAFRGDKMMGRTTPILIRLVEATETEPEKE